MPLHRIFFDIVVPMSSATGIYVFIITIVQGLQYVFTPIKVITQGGPDYASSNLIYMSYHNAFTLFKTGTSSAASVLTMLLFFVLLLLEFRFVYILVILFPILFAVSNSFKTTSDAFNTILEMIPRHPTLDGYKAVFAKLPFFRIVMNTFLIAVSVTIAKTFTSLLAAYSFVYFDYKGKTIIYFMMLLTMFVPFTVTMIPNYLLITQIGLRDNIWGVALPQMADVLGIFLLRQAMRGIPRSLVEAAKLDNIPDLKIMKDIILPLVRPCTGRASSFSSTPGMSMSGRS